MAGTASSEAAVNEPSVSIVGKIANWVARDCDLSRFQMGLIRVVFGLFACYAGTIFLEQYWTARSGSYFNLPLLATVFPVPPLVHKTILLAIVGFGLLILLDRMTPLASFGLSLCFAYVLLSDYFGFRHVWVLLGSLYLIYSVVAIRRPLYLGQRSKSGASPCVQQFALLGLRLYVAMAYLLAAIAKMDAGFLSGAILERLVEHWGPSSVIKATLDAIPYSYSGMAVTALIVEILLPVTLLVPRWRGLGIITGFLFHNAVPFLGWVGHSLNFYFVGSYLFFCGNPQRSVPVGNWRRLQNVPRLGFAVALVGWYVAIWLLMLLLKLLQSKLYIGVLVLTVVCVWLVASKILSKSESTDHHESYWREQA